MVYFYFLILFVMHCSFEACNSTPSRDVLVLIGDCSHDDYKIQDMAYCQALNKYNLFGNTRRELFKFLKIKTPPLFLICKQMHATLDSKLITVSRPDMPDDLEKQLLFLSQFKFSHKRKWFAWQVLSDRYFERYDGLINQRNSKLTFSDPHAFAFHATIDFHEQSLNIYFARGLDKGKIDKPFEQKDLDRLNNQIHDPNADPFALSRLYIDIGFLNNFDWISKLFKENPTYEKITPYDQCMISYLSSALDIDWRNRSFNRKGIQDFLQEKTSQKKFIEILKTIKKKIKTIGSDPATNKDGIKEAIGKVLDCIFGREYENNKESIAIRLKTALIDFHFLARHAYSDKPEFDYVLIKATHKYCNNKNEQGNFIENFGKTLTSFLPPNLIFFDNKKPNRLLQIPLWLQAQILKLPPHYFIPTQCLFWAGIVFVVAPLAGAIITLLMINSKKAILLLSKHSL